MPQSSINPENCNPNKMANNHTLDIGKQIGEGFWAKVYLADWIDNNEQHTKCVVKILKNDFFRRFLHRLLGTRQKLANEAKLFQRIYGFGEIITVNDKPSVVLPNLGDDNLSNLLDNAEVIKTIQPHQWLGLFYSIVSQVEQIHLQEEQIHNDIKPENICLKRDIHSDGTPKFTVNLIDFGNVHTINEAGVIGDPAYQPPEIYPGSILPIKNEKVDVYALGKTFYEVSKALVKANFADKLFLQECTPLFVGMCAFRSSKRPSLFEVKLALAAIAKKYHNESSPETVASVLRNSIEFKKLKQHGELLAQDHRNHSYCCALLNLKVDKAPVIKNLLNRLDEAETLDNMQSILADFYTKPEQGYATLAKGQNLTTRALGFFGVKPTCIELIDELNSQIKKGLRIQS